MATPEPRAGGRRLHVATRGLTALLTVRGTALALSATVLVLAACTIPSGTPAATGPASSGGTAPASGSPSPSTAPRSSSPSSTPTPSETPPLPTAAACTRLVSELSLAERVGQLLMVSSSSTGLSTSRAAMIGRTHAGSVLLLGNSKAGVSATQQVIADVRDAADRPQRVNVMVAADQEGGLVQRLAGSGFADIPSAVLQAKLSDESLATEAETWGDGLDKAGINVNLAPVADVVPRNLVAVNQPIGQLRRGYGPSPSIVARKVAAYTTGMDNAGIATAVKHFPGLGRVRGNTDTEARVVDTVTTRKDPALKGFQAAVDARVDMVMVSSAIYRQIDAKQQATFSPTVIGTMIRGDLGFDGVVISDDLAAKGVSDVPANQRVIRFLLAGGDLAIVADPDLAEASAKALVARAESDSDFAARVDESAARVLAMKDRRGLIRC